jgi:predicted LPLAT superfamily acyltransferase
MSAGLAASEWRRRPERGSPLLMRIMAWMTLHSGRSLGHPILHIIAVYFFLFAPRARRYMRD